MLVSSKLFPEGTKSSTHTLVLRHGPRHVLVPVPKTFQELLTITRSTFGGSPGSTFVFETSDFNIWPDTSVEIHPTAWEAIAMTVSTVIVKNKDGGSSREYGQVSLRPHIRGNTSVTPKRAQKTASGSSNEVMRSENSPSGAGTSYDDIPDALPTDDLAEEDLASYDDNDYDIDAAPLAQRKGKGKARVRIESDDEPEDGDEDGYVVKLPASYRLRNAVEPSFSITPSSSSPKRVTTATPPRTVRGSGGARGLFSPIRVRSGLAKTFQPAAHSDEEADVKPPAYQTAHVASDELPRLGRASNATPLKETQNDDPTLRSTSKPTLRLATAVDATTVAPNDKLLITIRHPPTEKENKFKVKAVHTVGRVLSSACLAFGLDASGASLMHWSEDDGLETSYRCGNDLSMGSVAVDGAIFIIELAKKD